MSHPHTFLLWTLCGRKALCLQGAVNLWVKIKYLSHSSRLPLVSTARNPFPLIGLCSSSTSATVLCTLSKSTTLALPWGRVEGGCIKINKNLHLAEI